MSIGVSLFLIAVGAILAWGVNVTVSGLDISTIGVILMVIGAVGLVLGMLFWSSFSPYGARRGVVEDEVVGEPALVRRRVVRRGEYLP